MHRSIPYAHAHLAGGDESLRGELRLPNLAALLRRLAPGDVDAAGPSTLNPPHERAFAAVVGWRGADGTLPFAARAAAADGLDGTDGAAWGLVTPTHWQVGRENVSLVDPAGLALDQDEAEARRLFDAARELFDGAGVDLRWGAPGRWYARADALDGLPCAALDRAIGRDVAPWLQASTAHGEAGRAMRRLQSEFQMLLYPHPVNAEREARGAWTVNSFWLSGCGRFQPEAAPAPTVDDRLRAPVMADDATAWAAAWRELDAGPLAELLAADRRGEPVALTLCGERAAQTWTTAPRSIWRRMGDRLGLGDGPTPATVLEAL